MTTIESIKTNITENLNHAQMKADAVKLQFTLGKAEFNDKIREKRVAVVNAADNLSIHLAEIGASAGTVKDDISAKVDNFKLQVALCKMEGKKSVEQAQAEFIKASIQFELAIEKTTSIAQEKYNQVKFNMTDYMAKISSLKASVEAKKESLQA